MREIHGEIVLNGLNDYEKIVDQVIKELDYEKNYFNMKLILTESLSNAFIHGNDSDPSKPIYLKYTCSNGKIILEIEDLGLDKTKAITYREIINSDPLKESGRGLYLISCFCDNVELKNNKLTIYIDKFNDGKRKGDII